MRRLLLIAIVMTMTGGSAALAATIPYLNDYDSAGLPNTTSSSSWTHDAANGEWDLDRNNPSSNTTLTSSEEFTNLDGEAIQVRTRFTLSDLMNRSSSLTNSVGFGVFGSNSSFGGSYYLVDWGLRTSSPGTIRILEIGGSGSTAVNSTIPGDEVVIGEEYEFLFTATPNGGALDMTFQVFDGSGVQIGGTATASDSTPLTGNFVGYRNRMAANSSAVEILDVDYDFLSIQVVPEPSTAFLAVCVGLCGLAGRRYRV